MPAPDLEAAYCCTSPPRGQGNPERSEGGQCRERLKRLKRQLVLTWSMYPTKAFLCDRSSTLKPIKLPGSTPALLGSASLPPHPNGVASTAAAATGRCLRGSLRRASGLPDFKLVAAVFCEGLAAWQRRNARSVAGAATNARGPAHAIQYDHAVIASRRLHKRRAAACTMFSAARRPTRRDMAWDDGSQALWRLDSFCTLDFYKRLQGHAVHCASYAAPALLSNCAAATPRYAAPSTLPSFASCSRTLPAAALPHKSSSAARRRSL